jgi:ABC-2 type transport system permease protein
MATIARRRERTVALPEFLDVMLATTRAEISRKCAYTIEVVRWPLWPVLYFSVLYLAYQAAGRDTVGGVSAAGFLLVGVFGMGLWSTSVWTSGYAVEWERSEGTINSLLLTPANRTAVVLGYGFGAMLLWVLPTTFILMLLTLATGARFNVSDSLAVLLAGLALVGAAQAMGYLLSGLFVLTRRANMFANFIQSPIYLLSGMVVPLDQLPDWLRWFSYGFPFSYGMTALRAALLDGALLDVIAAELALCAATSAIAVIGGAVLLRRVEEVAKRGGQLDFD